MDADGLQKLRALPSPLPASGQESYVHERELALAYSERRRDNYERYRASFRRSSTVDYLPIVLDIENVSRCNFRCVMCLTNDFKNGKRARDMTLEEFQRLIDEQYGLVEIKLHGIGEPLLQGDEFFEMIRYARAQHIWVRTVTNGSLLHRRENYKKLVDTDINEIQISIDGADKPVYEAIRRHGDFEQVAENCRRINEYSRSIGKLRTKMWTVVQRDNLHQLEQLVDLAADLGFSCQVFSLQVHAWGSQTLAERNQGAKAENSLNEERLLALVERGKQLGLDVWFWNITHKYSAETPEKLCPWPFERAFIGSDGRTVPCSMIANPDVYEIGKGKSFAENWPGEEYRAFREAHLAGEIPPVCVECYLKRASGSSIVP